MSTLFDYLQPFENFLVILNRNSFANADIKYFDAYRDFLKLRESGMTYYASLETVSERHHIAVGTLRAKFKKFSQGLKI